MSDPAVAEPPPPTALRPQPRNFRATAASLSHRSALFIDRAAHAVIAVGGIAIIAAVLGIGLFLLAEIAPLIRGARITPQPSHAVLPAGDAARLVLVDEHQEKAAVLGAAP